MKLELTSYHFEQIVKNGYSLDTIFLLLLAEEEDVDVCAYCESSPKLEAMCQNLIRKGLLNEHNKVTLSGRAVLDFLKLEDVQTVKLVKKKKIDTEFQRWWKAYPGTDTFTYKNKKFSGTRTIRVKVDECKAKIDKILDEGDYTIDDLVSALEFEVLQKKENSIKTNTNKLTYMQNSLTYLNQRTFEPFIELIKEGETIKEEQVISGGTDI